MTVWRINVKGEPPPQFSWWKDGLTFLISHFAEIHWDFWKFAVAGSNFSSWFEDLSTMQRRLRMRIFTETFQVERLRQTTITRLRLKNTREEQRQSCRYWRHRWDLPNHQNINKMVYLLHQMSDAGTYTLRAENRNGSDKVSEVMEANNILIMMKVDLDLVVLETGHDAECELLKSGNLECRCSQSFR